MHNPPVTVPKRPHAIAGFFAGLALAAIAGCGSETDDRPAKWSFISATIAQPMCATASCHSPFVKRAGVDLHDRESGYHSLVDRLFVRPGLPDASALITIMRGQGSIRMPPDFPLPEVDIELFERWITDGARNE
jgi:hypothetical protein